MSTLQYYFDDLQDEAFEYDVNLSDWLSSLSNELKVDLVRYFYTLVDEYKNDLKEYDKDLRVEDININNMSVVNDLLFEIDRKDILEEFEDNIKDYFYADAKEAYNDANEYHKDPYGYNGVRQSDFL